MPRRSIGLLAVENRKRPFTVFAHRVASAAGRPAAFGCAVLFVVAWIATGPLFDFSTSWQLVVNTGTTIVTFFMVFLIQHTQNRDAIAVQIKLDELIRADADAHNALLDLEELTEEELEKIKDRYEHLAREAREALRKGRSDIGIREV